MSPSPRPMVWSTSARTLALAALALLLCLWSGACAKPAGAAPQQQVAAGASSPQPPPVAHYEITITKTYPHDPEAFTQGLVFSDGFLYESTGLHGRSSLRKVDLETGAVIKMETLARDLFGEGLTLWRGRLIQLTWRSGIALVYDLATLQRAGEFQYDSEGWGLTHDGQALIMSDGTELLRFLDPDTFSEERRIEVLDGGNPVRNLNALAYIHNEIFANIWKQDHIAIISPASGRVRAWIDLTSLRRALGPARGAEVLNGIAYDAAHDRIFVTGKCWPKLFEIKLIPK